MPEIHSFDVFDTCITRIYSQPTDLFLQLASVTLQEQHSDTDKDTAIQVLAQQRVVAESNARKHSSREDIQIADIYSELSRFVEISFDPQAMLSMELELELQSMVPVQSTLAQYQEIKLTGKRVIFISDIYLPMETVIAMLLRCGYEANVDNLYLSGEVGLTKRSGNLYTHVLHKEGVQPTSITHHGDNLISDIRMAKAKGLKTVYIPAFQLASPYESLLLYRSNIWQKVSYKLQRASRHFRKFYRSPISKLPSPKQIALSRVSAASRILLNNQSDNGYVNHHLLAIGYFVAAPLFNAFVLWVLNTARANGIDKLYFVARNGQIFYRLAEKINSARGYNLELRYLYGSRAAWYPSSFELFDTEFIDLLVNKYPRKSVVEIFKDLSLSDENIATLVEAITRSGQGANSATDKDTVKALLLWLSESQYCEIISDHFESSWRNVVDYLSQEQVFDQSKFGIVDIGWHLSCHNALHRIVRRVNSSGFSGFYFGVGKKRQEVADGAPYFAFFSDVTSRKNSWLFKLGAMLLLEEVFAAADHPTTSSYYREENQVFPYMNEKSHTYDSRIAETIQGAMLEFTEFMLRKGTLDDLSLVNDDVLAQFERLYKFPTAQEAMAIANTPVFALTSHSISQRRTLAHRIRIGELFDIIFKVIFRGRNISPEWMWLSGSMAMSNGFVALAGKLLSFLESSLLKLKR